MALGFDQSPASFAVMGRAASDQQVKYAKIDTATGDTTLVAADAVGKIRVLSFQFVVKTTAVDITFKSGTGGTALTGAMSPAAGTVFSAPFHPYGHFETAAATLLNLNQSGTSQISGWLTYQIVDPLD